MDDKNSNNRATTFPNPEEAVKEGINRLFDHLNEKNSKQIGLELFRPDQLNPEKEYLKVYFIRHDMISKFNAAESPKNLLIDLNERIYPIGNDNEVVSSVTIRQKISTEWEIKSIGDTRLIKEVTTLMRELGNGTRKFFLVSIPSLYYVFLAYEDDGQQLKLKQLGTTMEEHHKLTKDINSKDTSEILLLIKAEAINNHFPLTEEEK